jgi:hypothetical protein
MASLVELIETAHRDYTYRELELRCGGVIHSASWLALANGRRPRFSNDPVGRVRRRQTVSALAQALGQPLDVVDVALADAERAPARAQA